MLIVVDTNVFISGVFFSGPPFLILQAWRNGKFELAISPEIMEEYRKVGEILRKEHQGIDLEPVQRYILLHAQMFKVLPLAEPVCTDPSDDMFLACAEASGSPYIISGDKHLLKVSNYHGIIVMKPREFVDRFMIES